MYSASLGHASQPLIVGKAFHKASLARRIYERLEVLYEYFKGEPNLAAPEPLAVVPELALVVMRAVQGQALKPHLAGPNSERCAELTARWLTVLNGQSPPSGVKRRSWSELVERLQTSYEGVAEAWSGPARARSERILGGLRDAEPALRSTPQALTHGDYSIQNVFWDGRTTSVIDFDSVRVADPVTDVARLITHLQRRSLSRTGRIDAFAAFEKAFVRSYIESSPPQRLANLTERLPLLCRYSLLKHAATETKRRRKGWRGRAEQLVELAAGLRDYTPAD